MPLVQYDLCHFKFPLKKIQLKYNTKYQVNSVPLFSGTVTGERNGKSIQYSCWKIQQRRSLAGMQSMEVTKEWIQLVTSLSLSLLCHISWIFWIQTRDLERAEKGFPSRLQASAMPVQGRAVADISPVCQEPLNAVQPDDCWPSPGRASLVCAVSQRLFVSLH